MPRLNIDVVRHIQSYLFVSKCDYCNQELCIHTYKYPTTCSYACLFMHCTINIEAMLIVAIIGLFILS